MNLNDVDTIILGNRKILEDSYWSSWNLCTNVIFSKDFCGQKCFTPDCEGIIIKIQIVDAMESMTIENKRLNERLEQEEEEEERKKKKEGTRVRWKHQRTKKFELP